MNAVEILERAEDRLRRLANDCALTLGGPDMHLNTERTAHMVEDSLDEVRQALAALRGPEPEMDAFLREVFPSDSGSNPELRTIFRTVILLWEQRPRGEQ